MIRSVSIAALLALAACNPSTPAPNASDAMLGVLEERVSGEGRETFVRAAFEYSDGAWRVIDTSAPANLPPETEWTISLAGEALGQVHATTPEAWALIADAGRQNLAPGATAPTHGEPSATFAGWAGEPVHRPLAATSPAAPANPDPWSAQDLTPEARAAVLAAFRATFPDVANCTNATENTPRPITYSDADLAISAPLHSQSGWRLASVSLSGYACDGPIYETAYAPQLIVVSPAGEARVLGEGLIFLDAADFNADGAGEILFAIDRYNAGGYELHAGDFTESAVFEFSYH